MLKNMPDFIVPDDAIFNMNYWLKWVDKLLGEKKSLQAKIAELEEEIKDANKAHHDELKHEYEGSSKWQCECNECINYQFIE